MDSPQKVKQMKIPNYTMFRFMIMDYQRVLDTNPEADQMPLGFICPGYDVKLMPVLATLRYLHGVKTQWSCQGDHKTGQSRAYILLEAKALFPKDLIKKLKEKGFVYSSVPDYDNELNKTGLRRKKISSISYSKKASYDELQTLNLKFLKVLNSWAMKEMKKHVKNMEDPYFNDVRKWVKCG